MDKENEKQELIIQISEIEKITNNTNKNELLQTKEEITNNILNNIEDKLQCQIIFDKISSILNLVQKIFNEKIEKTIKQYESIIRRDEQTIRILYKNILVYKLLKDSLDNKIRLLLIKEKEYELIKDKTGAYFRNGELFYNKQKDNEIIILRTENSNLKNIVENYENIITEKDLLYENLKKKYNNVLNKINKNKVKKLSIPNININLSDSSNLTNIDNNTFHYSINLNKSDKPRNNSDEKNYKNFNYLKYKNITKNNIPYNNSLSFKNIFKNSLLDLSPKDIFGIKKSNSKSSSLNNKKAKKLSLEYQKDICSLKKKNFKIDDAFRNHVNKNQFNLLQAYTANSSKSINKSPLPKKLSTYSNDVKISSYHTKNNYSQKINLTNNKKEFSQKKNNQGTVESEILHKSYVNSIPYNKEKENSSRVLKKESYNTNNKYQLIYCKTKKENNSKNLYRNKNNNKTSNNINTNKIFLPLNVKRNITKYKKE